MTRAFRALTLLAAVALLGAAPDPNGDGAYFTGTWKCGGDVVWTFAPLIDGGDWIRITYGNPQHPDGTAAMGSADALTGRITYTEVNPTRYDRTFEMLKDGTYHAMGGDSCLKQT